MMWRSETVYVLRVRLAEWLLRMALRVVAPDSAEEAALARAAVIYFQAVRG